MKKHYLLLLFFIPFLCHSQKEKLFYFVENDSLIGVKDQNGAVIIPAKRTLFPSNYKGLTKKEIKDTLLLFWFWDKGPMAYDRKGNFLFVPYIFDAGIDYFQEGFMRFTENNKIGIANKNGKKIISAKYDFISSVNFGIITYCNGCYWDRKKDDEHPPLVGGTWGYLDENGYEIKVTDNRNNPKDKETENHKFIPYQFKYNKKEEGILAYFNTRKETISKILHANCNGCERYQIYFEIVDRPNNDSDYYKIKLYEILDSKTIIGCNDNEDYKNFSVTSDGKHFYVNFSELKNYKTYSEYINKTVTVDQWIKNNLKD